MSQLNKILKLKNDISQVALLEKFTEEIGNVINLPIDFVMSLNLAIEELVANTIQYGYPTGMEDIISIEAIQSANVLTFIIQDAGVEFDPTVVPEADINLNLEQRKIGGLGLFLAKKNMDEITYKRINNKNILTLKKHIK
ncbi:hypothetical protein SDC9_165707 [bioreactor metagenome]|uniref:Histidine kinase/HSP90-like ATPase domain-containing protein n=1 Tax=bioreactor metagenome TaxID=1076179 RepID=A0A645FV75_9ZZZZ